MVDYYGVPTPVTQTAGVSVQEGRCLVIAPWDVSILKGIEKAIQLSNIGITPTNDGKVIRLVFPELTEERRKELSKQVRKMGEDAKVAARNNRRDAMEGLKKLKNDKNPGRLRNRRGNAVIIHHNFIQNVRISPARAHGGKLLFKHAYGLFQLIFKYQKQFLCLFVFHHKFYLL